MNMKQKTLGEKLFDPRWLASDQVDARDLDEPPVGLDLARALAAKHLDPCDLGEADLAKVASALGEEERRSLQDFLDGVRTEPPASLMAPTDPPTASSRSWSGGDVSLLVRCAEVLAPLAAPRWIAAAGVLLVLGGLTSLLLIRVVAPQGREDRAAWASMVVAATPAKSLEDWSEDVSPSPASSVVKRSRSSAAADRRVVAVKQGDAFQSGAVVGPRQVLTSMSGVASQAEVFTRHGDGWARRLGKVRTVLPGLDLALVFVDEEFEVWFDLALEEGDAEDVVPPTGTAVVAHGFGGVETGVLESSARDVSVGDLIYTTVAMRSGLGGAALVRPADSVLIGIVVGAHDGTAVAVPVDMWRQQVSNEDEP